MIRKRHPAGFECATCGKWHDHIPTDFGFQLPDELWSMPKNLREKRVVSSEDLAALDKKRYFVRGVAMVPFTHTDGYFGWGLWVKVSKKDFFHYIENHKKKGEALRSFMGEIANALPGYRSLVGKIVEVQPGQTTQRPTLWFPQTARHTMALEQRAGIGATRYHAAVHENLPGLLD